MKKTLILITLIAALCSCSKDAAPGRHIGKWKVLTIGIPNTDIAVEWPNVPKMDSTDVSKENIIFEFKNDGFLTISENPLDYIDADWLTAHWNHWIEALKTGTHAYSMSDSGRKKHKDEVVIRLPLRIYINNEAFRCSFQNNETTMTLRFDGELCLERID